MRTTPMPSACASCASRKHSPIKNLFSYYQREANQREGDRRLGYSRAYRTNRHDWHNCGAPGQSPPCDTLSMPMLHDSRHSALYGRGHGRNTRFRPRVVGKTPPVASGTWRRQNQWPD